MLDTMKARLRQWFNHSSGRRPALPLRRLRLEALEGRLARPS
jgi:hypothetical protein